MKRNLSILLLLVGTASAWAQTAVTPSTTTSQAGKSTESGQAAYEKVTQERAAKIVAGLNVADTNRAIRVRDLIARQYQDLSRIHDAVDLRVEEIRKQSGGDKEAADAGIKAAQNEANGKVELLHKEYLAKLSVELSAEQTEKVKDGMTYGVVPLTYGVYLRMFPSLTDDQKRHLLTELQAGREIAMDAGSSKAKHAVFGKYKGRINNYLVAQGYDLKEGERNLKASSPPPDGTKPK